MGQTGFSKSANGTLPYQVATAAMESNVLALASEVHKGYQLRYTATNRTFSYESHSQLISLDLSALRPQ